MAAVLLPLAERDSTVGGVFRVSRGFDDCFDNIVDDSGNLDLGVWLDSGRAENVRGAQEIRCRSFNE